MKNISIDEQKAIAKYNAASPEGKLLLEETLGKELFAGNIIDKVKTFEDACKVLGKDTEKCLPVVDDMPEYARATVTFAKLVIIIEALNEGWKPNYDDGNERKWYPWFTGVSGRGLSLSYVVYVRSVTDVGPRLVLKSEELARYAGTQFLEVYNEYFQ